MDISTRRFIVESDGFGNAVIRDRNAPYHPHVVPLGSIPSTYDCAMMSENEFDKAISRAIYR